VPVSFDLRADSPTAASLRIVRSQPEKEHIRRTRFPLREVSKFVNLCVARSDCKLSLGELLLHTSVAGRGCEWNPTHIDSRVIIVLQHLRA